MRWFLPILASVAGCGMTLDVLGEGFVAEEGHVATGAILDVAERESTDERFTDVLDGQFHLHWSHELDADFAYRVFVWVEIDGDGICSPADKVYDVDLGTVTDATAVTIHEDDPVVGACAFDGIPLFTAQGTRD